MNEAPRELEEKLLAMFRAHHRGRRRNRWLGFAGALAAAVLLGIELMPRPATKGVTPIVVPKEIAKDVPVAAPPVKAAKKRKKKRAQEVMTAYFPLPYGSGAPLEAVHVVRVRVPRSAMTMVGLPVNPERSAARVDADVVLGQDGLARAIRFVSLSQ